MYHVIKHCLVVSELKPKVELTEMNGNLNIGHVDILKAVIAKPKTTERPVTLLYCNFFLLK